MRDCLEASGPVDTGLVDTAEAQVDGEQEEDDDEGAVGRYVWR